MASWAVSAEAFQRETASKPTRKALEVCTQTQGPCLQAMRSSLVQLALKVKFGSYREDEWIKEFTVMRCLARTEIEGQVGEFLDQLIGYQHASL